MARRKKEEEERLRDHAYHIYTQDIKSTQKEIASRVGVTQATVSKWVTEGNWGKKRRSLLTTKSSQLSLLYDQLEKINTEIATREESNYASTKEANTIIQLTAAIKNLETETSIGEIIQVAKDFTEYVSGFDYEQSKTIVKLLDEFINQKMK